MGTIEILGKWNSEKNVFETSFDPSLAGTSFGIATYEPIKNIDGEEFDYIVISSGCRIENFTKDSRTINESHSAISKFIDFFANQKRNVLIKLIMLDKDDPLKEQGKLLASQIDLWASLPETKSINFLGHSKAAIMSFDMLKYFKNPLSYLKTNLYTTCAPFTGTIIASPDKITQRIEASLKERIPSKLLIDMLMKIVNYINDSMSSYSHMDFDIAPPGSISPEYMHLYDPSFITDIFSENNLNALSRLKSYTNICTKIDDGTLKDCIATANYVGVGLCLLDELVFDEPSDGFVTYSSQRLVEKHVLNREFKSVLLRSSHHGFMTSMRLTRDVMGVMEENLEMQDEIKQYRLCEKRIWGCSRM